MKQFIIGTMVLVLVSIASIKQTVAQPRFEVPLRVTDGVATDTLYFGILPGGHFCIDPADSINGHVEFFIPAVPLAGIFDARLIWPRTGSNALCFDMGGRYDFRPFRSIFQIDTFRVGSQLGMGTTMVLSWPANLSTRFNQLTLRYFDQVAGQNVHVNMLTNTSVDITDGGDPARVSIFAGELPLSVGQASRDVPERLLLYQNYPNPFNPSTRIGFSVPGTEYVSLKVFDLLGREVATLVEGKQERGEHSVEWKAEGLPSGVYICRLTTASATASRKMLLLR